MLRISAILVLLSASLNPKPTLAWSSSQLPDQFHRDDRQTAKLVFMPKTSRHKKASKGRELVEQYLREQGQSFGIAKDLKNLRFAGAKRSLLATHFSYQQVIDNIPVEHGEIIVSVEEDGRQIRSVYNNIYPYKASPLGKKMISPEEAYDIAWAALRVHGRLTEAPSLELIYRAIKQKLVLQYHVKLSVDKPYGAWSLHIDAATGNIKAIEDLRLTRRPKKAIDFDKYKGKIADRKKAFQDYASRLKEAQRPDATAMVDLKTQLFDPDPRTRLQNPALEDDSPKELFAAAYDDKILRQVAYADGFYSLRGSWVQIIDFDPPYLAPHHQEEDHWHFERGALPFNEAMSYFHIDQSQRYIQELGFSGESGIQELAIEVDASGANGDDNSYFQPSTNRLSFGHGCVDDNEDADVILHEYGHAIQASINSNWVGGDTGAMGEGFGDYWAASYSISTPHGQDYLPNEIFSWDGHGEENSCWNGRILNATDARYQHSKTYGAHMQIEGGFQSDELWSTPLFQSLQQLLALGFPREDMDRIVLQSHFGLGAEAKMRDLALNTLFAAEELFPDGPHKDVLFDNFAHHGIIELPRPVLRPYEISWTDGNDGIFVPGEIITLKMRLTNEGSLDATNFKGSFAVDYQDISISPKKWMDINLPIGSRSEKWWQVEIQLPNNIPCGTRTNVKLSFDGQDPRHSHHLNLPIQVGRAVEINFSKSPEVLIPDDNTTGVSSTLELRDHDFLVSDNFQVAVDLSHPYSGDLRIELESPSGKRILLRDRSGGGSDDIRGIFGEDLESAEPLTEMLGQRVLGTWTLHVFDQAPSDEGTLHSWGISDISHYLCPAAAH